MFHITLTAKLHQNNNLLFNSIYKDSTVKLNPVGINQRVFKGPVLWRDSPVKPSLPADDPGERALDEPSARHVQPLAARNGLC